MAKIYYDSAFLIHRRAYKDSSLLVDFLAKEYGKIRLIAKGVRKAKANIQMFQHLNISFTGKSELKVLTDWDNHDDPRILKGEKLILCFYVNELIYHLISSNEPCQSMFAIYEQFIQQITILSNSSQHWALRIFEDNLLSELGYALDYSKDINNTPIDAQKYYEYKEQLGFCENLTGKISGKLLTLLAIKNINKMPDKQQLKNCRDINRQRIRKLLGNKSLKSRSLFFIPKG